MLTSLQREHLRLIQSKEGRLDPREVLRDARNANSPLHDLFEWDDSAAADAYRLMQAKQVVRVVVRMVPQPRREAVRVTVPSRAVAGMPGQSAPVKGKTDLERLTEATIAAATAHVAAEIAVKVEEFWSRKFIPYPPELFSEMTFIDKYLRGVPISDIIEVANEILDEGEKPWDDARAQGMIRQHNLLRPPGWDETRAKAKCKADEDWNEWTVYGLPPYTPPVAKPHFPGADRASNGTLARFKAYTHNEAHTSKDTASLRPDHPALTENRTQFPTRVFDPTDADHVLVPGHNNAKVGGKVTKGPWAGMEIFTLTLEERKTCPASCDLLSSCYGNAMPLAKRWEYGPALITKLHEELHATASQHPAGFVVRLHILGDFPDIDYANQWAAWVKDIPQIHVFGYTAHPAHSLIGGAIAALNKEFPDRWAIRFSVPPDTEPMPMQATTIWRKEAGKVDEGVVCPASSGDTSCCGTCGLCWAPAFAGKRVVFLGHGMNRTKGGRPAQETNPELAAVIAPHKDVVISRPQPKVDLKVNPEAQKTTPFPPLLKVGGQSRPAKYFPSDSDVARFIAEKGVTKLPAAMAAPTNVELSPEDRQAVSDHTTAMQEAWSRARKRGDPKIF